MSFWDPRCCGIEQLYSANDNVNPTHQPPPMFCLRRNKGWPAIQVVRLWESMPIWNCLMQYALHTNVIVQKITRKEHSNSAEKSPHVKKVFELSTQAVLPQPPEEKIRIQPRSTLTLSLDLHRAIVISLELHFMFCLYSLPWFCFCCSGRAVVDVVVVVDVQLGLPVPPPAHVWQPGARERWRLLPRLRPRHR